VVTSTPAVTRVLAITGVDRLIAIYPSVAAAMADPGIETAHEGLAVPPGSAGQADQDGRAPQPG
jgi:hypothetical protein